MGVLLVFTRLLLTNFKLAIYDSAKIEFCEKGLRLEHDLWKFQFATFAFCRCLPVVAKGTLVGVFLESQVE